MSQGYYENIELVIVYLINYSIIANSNPPRISSAELACGSRARGGCQSVDCIDKAVLVRLRDPSERLLSRSLDSDCVIH
jgi:hypothetical protein